MNKKERTQAFITHFSKNMPEAKTELDYTNVFELTVAVILSAQCTDKRVNIITKNLFKSLPTAEVMAEVYTPGVMSAGLGEGIFWLGMCFALIAGFAAAYPVNYVLVKRGVRHCH